MLAAARGMAESIGLVTPTPLRTLAAVTESGAVEGTVWPAAGCEVIRFLAIPYAAPPTGTLRWKPPQPVEPWGGTRTTPTELPVCPQNGGMARGTFPGHSVLQTEDCLVLNVWTTALDPAAKMPVIFYIHGGAGKMGSAMTLSLSGHALAARGVCYVAINYRLGALGFMAHPELSAEDGIRGSSGNYAALDWLAALRWCQKNIAQFGGDPGNVTIWGLSSGAQYVNQLMFCPLAKGLFHRAMVQSSTDLANVRHLSRRSEIWLNKSAEEWGVEYATREVGIPATDAAGNTTPQLPALRETEVAKLLATSDSNAASDHYEACIDGWVKPRCTALAIQALLQQPSQQQQQQQQQQRFEELLANPRVSLMVGHTANDGLGSCELEHTMFEENDWDRSQFEALLRREFPSDDAFQQAAQHVFRPQSGGDKVDNVDEWLSGAWDDACAAAALAPLPCAGP